jgi:general secretion pathway protein G
MKKNAFTLLELLVVISILGVLVAVILPNLVGVRARARDSALKNDMRQLKTALRMYYNDNQTYPPDDGSGNIVACGDSGQSVCPNNDGSFAIGDLLYMKEMPTSEEYSYDSTSQGEDFLLSTVLENASDSDIADSIVHCGVETPAASNYYVCAD